LSDTIHDFVLSNPLFDAHEHLDPLPAFSAANQTYASIAGYAAADLQAARGPRPPGEENLPPVEDPRHKSLFFEAWRSSRNTGYCRAIERACRELLGLEYTEENADAIGAKLTELRGPDPAAFYSATLRRAGVRWAVKDSINTSAGAADGQYPDDLVRLNYRDDDLLTARTVDAIVERERRWNRSIQSLDDLETGLAKSMADCFATNRVTAVKIGVAYRRTLDFANATRTDAERAFSRLMQRGSGRPAGALSAAQPSDAELRPLHDWLTHRLVRLATDAGKTVQVHTGYLAGVWNDLRNVDPLALVPLLLTYRTTRFELFHAGWPHHEVLATMGKHYPNAWVSMVWAWTMNPSSMERALDAFLDAVPMNKIIAFGGDTHHPACTYAYARQARDGIARVLQSRLDRGLMDAPLAREAAERILLLNGCELHRLPA
jgi:hypothetical protein